MLKRKVFPLRFTEERRLWHIVAIMAASLLILILFHIYSGLGHVTGIGQWNISKHDTNGGSKSTCMLGLVLSCCSWKP